MSLFKFKINKWLTRAIIILVWSVCITAPNITIHAQTVGDFSVRAVIPDNQVDKNQTYFDLRMKPEDEQNIQIVITNSRAEELSAEISLNNATTGRNGLIVYTEPEKPNELINDSAFSEMPKISVTDVAVLQEQKVIIPAHSSETVTINIKMPDEPLDGVILGGIAVTGNSTSTDDNTDNTDNIDNTQKAQGVSLKNIVTYVIALKLTENDDAVEPDFELTEITPSLVNYKTAVVATLQNRAARIVKDMEVKAQVFKQNSEPVLRELDLSDAEMAPLSNGDFVIDWENQPLDKGIYRLRMTANYSGEMWEWDKEFTIGGDSDILNKEAVGLEKVNDNTWIYWLIGAAVLVLLLFIAYRQGKQKKKTETDKQNANL